MTSRFLAATCFTATGLMLAAAAPARAQAHRWDTAPAAYANDDYRASYADAQRAAFDRGYRNGLKRGEQAARDGRPLAIERERDYRSADEGYNRSYGDRNRYRDNYRGGFAQGYRDGYSRRGAGSIYPNSGYPNAGYPNAGYPNNGYPNAGRVPGAYGRGSGRGGTASFGAHQNGVADGYKKGLDDAGDRKTPDVTRHKWYRNGDHDYDSDYGSKDLYRVEYRRGFQEGYNRAYRERRRY